MHPGSVKEPCLAAKLAPSRRMLIIGIAQAAAALSLPHRSLAAGTPPRMTVTRDPYCGCCGSWVEHIRSAGFPVDVVEIPDVMPLKAKLGVPGGLMSCHTAEIDGYVIEGHVPAGAIRRLLVERPQARGIAVAGMPTGSPGMEVPGQPPQDYEVVAFSADGQRIFARYRGLQPI